MKDGHLAAWIVIVGLTWVIAASNVAADEQGGKAAHPSIAAQSGKPASGPVSNDQKGNPVAQGVEPQGEKPTPVYNPPPRGVPARLVPGGTRGPEEKLPMLSVLAPEDIGLTAQEQPSFYWYLSDSITSRIEFTLTDDQTTRPLLEISLTPPTTPGVQRVRLADYSVRLSPGVPYKWFVALIPDLDRRSKDIITGGAIERIELPAALRAKLTQAGKARTPHIYAEAGLWYDALTAISELIDAAPDDLGLRKQRASLLDQVRLPEVAESDMRHSSAK